MLHGFKQYYCNGACVATPLEPFLKWSYYYGHITLSLDVSLNKYS